MELSRTNGSSGPHEYNRDTDPGPFANLLIHSPENVPTLVKEFQREGSPLRYDLAHGIHFILTKEPAPNPTARRALFDTSLPVLLVEMASESTFFDQLGPRDDAQIVSLHNTRVQLTSPPVLSTTFSGAMSRISLHRLLDAYDFAEIFIGKLMPPHTHNWGVYWVNYEDFGDPSGTSVL